jgi:hypothetical protein
MPHAADAIPPLPSRSGRSFPIWRLFGGLCGGTLLLILAMWGYMQWRVQQVVAQLSSHGAKVQTRCPLIDSGPESLEWVARAVISVDFPPGAVRDDDIDVLARCPHLFFVSFEGSELTDAQVERLAAAWERGQLNRLRFIFFEKTPITNEALPHLARMTSLERIRLDTPAIDAHGVASLAALPKLEGLGLFGVSETEGISATLASFPALIDLTLADMKLTDADLEIVTQRPLRLLSLAGTDITDDSLALVGRMASLRTLYIDSTKISDAGLEHLLALPSLKGIDLQGTQVTLEGVRTLLHAQPRLSVSFDITNEQYDQFEEMQRMFPDANLIPSTKPAMVSPLEDE